MERKGVSSTLTGRWVPRTTGRASKENFDRRSRRNHKWISASKSSTEGSGESRLFLTKMPLSLILSLSPHDLVIWTDRSVPFPIWQAQLVQVFWQKPALLCKLFGGLGSSNEFAITLPSDSCSVFDALSSPLSFFYLKLSGRSSRNCFLSPPLLSGYNGFTVTCFFRATMRLMSWPGGSALLLLSAVPCSLFLLSILLLFSRIGGVLSRLNSSIHGSHGCSLRNLRFLVTLAVSSLVFAAMNTAFN